MTTIAKMTVDQLSAQAKLIRSTKDTVGKLKLIQEVPARQQTALLDLIELLGQDKQGVEVYMNKKGEASGISVYGEGLPKRGMYIANNAIKNWGEVTKQVEAYRLNPSHTF